MTRLILACTFMVVTGVACFADGQYWVVGNRATNRCEIVTSNPVIYPYGGGDVWFGAGPFQSLDDAKLARANIGACPKDNPPAG